MKTYKAEVTFKVHDMWIEDGFGSHNKRDEKRFAEQIQGALEEQLCTSANLSTEFKVSVKIIDHPDYEQVQVLQGYKQPKNKKS